MAVYENFFYSNSRHFFFIFNVFLTNQWKKISTYLPTHLENYDWVDSKQNIFKDGLVCDDALPPSQQFFSHFVMIYSLPRLKQFGTKQWIKCLIYGHNTVIPQVLSLDESRPSNSNAFPSHCTSHWE